MTALAPNAARPGGDAAHAPPVRDLSDLLVRIIERRLDEHGASLRRGPVFLFGAGRHTWWMLGAVPALRSLSVAAVLDDAPGHTSFAGLPLLTPNQAADRFGEPSAVILSTDTWQSCMAPRAAELFPGAAVIDLYEDLPSGPYLRGEGAYRAAPGDVITRPTEPWLRRCSPSLAGYFRSSGVTRPAILGPEWQTAALAEELRRDRLDPLPTPDGADAIVATERSADSRVLSLRNWRASWIDRDSFPTLSGATDDPIRILIRHDNHLGDVILSQGILPERLKRQLFPNAHIAFMTTGAAVSRHGSATTGWCLDLIAANPFIDERLPIGASTDGFDLIYRITDSGDLEDHVFDHHALRVELPPGVTNARVHLWPGDLAIADELLDGVRRPVIALNMGLIQPRFRGWGAEKTAALGDRLESDLGAAVIWIGWNDFHRYRRPTHNGAPLSVREQAALLSRCDLHIATQGGGANLSAAVGCQTLSLSGCHPPQREGVAFFTNRYVEDPSRRHVELYRYRGELRRLTYARTPDPAWCVEPDQDRETLREYARELWDRERPAESLPDAEPYRRVRDLTVDEVFDTVAEMLAARREGRPIDAD
ncbi:MAG: hypothetical protein VYC34_05350 [Planctomycetota bacterium]|nr:hypothetical protein [Planctomycetota bacterium]